MAPKREPIHPAKRAALRVLILSLGPVVVFFLGLGQSSVLFCSGVALLWSCLEVSLVYRVKFCWGCRKVPFPLRLLSAVLLCVQACLLLPASEAMPSTEGETGSELPAEQSSAADAPEPAADVLPPLPSAASIRTMSVILPCASETGFVLKTVQSVHAATPDDQLEEIIVIDDASHPKVVDDIGGDEQILAQYKAHLIRHETAEGLIRTKKEGGDKAKGDIIVFLDCHVKPIEGWTQAIFSNLRENPKRAVVPLISSLNPDTWEEASKFGGNKMCMTWRADFFWCDAYPGPEIPIMSGGLLALTKYWWEVTGGLDEEMHAWGGENLDQSLRTWLCGGEVHVAKGSRVAHMWREASKPKTRLHYAIPTEHVRRNRMRAARAWMGEWADKLLTFPEFEDFKEGGRLHVDSLEVFDRYKKKLKCKGFDWYIEKFRHYYVDTGALPPSVFNLREKTTGLCIHHEYQAGKSHAFVMAPCGQNSELQRFHPSNTIGSGGCCSGLKAWDWDACLQMSGGQKVTTSACTLFGGSNFQYFDVSSDGLIKVGRDKKKCLVPDSHASDKPPDDHAQLVACAAGKSGQSFQKVAEQDDGSFELHESGECISYAKDGEGDPRLMRLPCESVSSQARRWTYHDEQLKNLEANLCLDAGNQWPILYHCYQPRTNSKQKWSLTEDGLIQQPRSWNDNGRLFYPSKCLDLKPLAQQQLSIVGCDEAKKKGHTWEKLWEEVPLESKLYASAKGKQGFLGRLRPT
eukprot:TRINITY_DN92784_c0_g1_i1.p1 TRINITY_DN92784_c0_g1~~TRINITY_DN92784_c0_g1_i1.p1  ORF type:complete len:781 (+),score=146.08 TRINITY_DN92784_c0_g1_i1:107-2344(+)